MRRDVDFGYQRVNNYLWIHLSTNEVRNITIPLPIYCVVCLFHYQSMMLVVSVLLY